MNKLFFSGLLLFACHAFAQHHKQIERLTVYLDSCRIDDNCKEPIWDSIRKKDLSEKHLERFRKILLNEWDSSEVINYISYCLKYDKDLLAKEITIKLSRYKNPTDSIKKILESNQLKDQTESIKTTIATTYRLPPQFVFLVARFHLNQFIPILVEAMQTNNPHYDKRETKLVLARMKVEPFHTEMIQYFGYNPDKNVVFKENIYKTPRYKVAHPAQDLLDVDALLYISSQEAIYEITKTFNSTLKDCAWSPCDDAYYAPIKYKYLQELYINVLNCPLHWERNKKRYDLKYDFNNYSGIYSKHFTLNIPFPDDEFIFLQKWFEENKGKYQIKNEYFP